MATCPEITKKYARQYVKAGKAEKWRLQDALVATTGWAGDNSRRATAWLLLGRALPGSSSISPVPADTPAMPWTYCREVCRLVGQPSGKCLVAVMLVFR